MKILQSILLLLLYSLPSFSQQTFDWKILTYMGNVQSIAASDSGIWAATSGGAFFYNTETGTYTKLTKAEGLTGIFLTAAAVDRFGKVWLGSSSGTIDVYNPADNSLNSILDIYNNSDKILKSINELRAFGDTLFVSTSYGVTLININTMVPLDTYSKFGALTSNQQVNTTFSSALVYASTENGLAVQKPGATNLSSPDSWNVYTTAQGLPSNKILKVIEYNGIVYAATSEGLAAFNGSNWGLPQDNVLSDNSSGIIDMYVSGNSLYLLTETRLLKYEPGSITEKASAQNFRKVIVNKDSKEFIAVSSGILTPDNGNNLVLKPNGPPANQFPEMAVDKNGALWSASGKDVKGVGFYKYDGETWTTFNATNNPQFQTNDFYSAYSSPDNKQYMGTWGRGFVRVSNNTLDVFNADNTGMVGIDNDPSFLIITGFGTDSKNNLWVLNYWATDHRTLSMMSPGGAWSHFSVPVDNVSIEHHYQLIVDQYDTKWYIIRNQNKSGLIYFNENKTIENTNDDRSGFLTTTQNLNSNTINSIVIDKRGDIWVGTPSGVNVISNTNAIINSSNPQLRITSVYSLRQQTVNCMVVDPLNQKWIGTNQGILLVNSDGSSVLASYTSRNSALPGDVIRSLTIDETSGTVYVGTDEGLTSFKTLSIKPSESFTELFIYPSPFIFNKGNNVITIDGLIKESEIKILSVSGKLIKVIETSEVSPGGYRALWDGRDIDGNQVNSGVYIVVAYDSEGSNVATGKIAILRE